MKTLKLLLISVIPLFILTQCGSGGKNENRISLSGAFALYPLTIKWSEEYKKMHPEVQFDIQAGGAGKGMTDALNGTVDLGMFSREITEIEKEKGVWWVAVTKDAVLPTINSRNPALSSLKSKGLTKDHFRKIFAENKLKTWGAATGTEAPEPINIYTRSDACGAAATWAAYFNCHQEDLKGIGVFGDPGLADAVANDPLAIGFNNTIYIYDLETGHKREFLEIIPIDVNENGKIDEDENFYDNFGSVLKAISVGKYPSPPARELYFVSKGKPQNAATLSFLSWVLTEGQKYVSESGYVPLEKQIIEQQVAKLN